MSGEGSARWEQAIHWPMLLASFAWLVAYSWSVIAVPVGADRTLALAVMGVTWVFFVVDYVVRLVQSGGHLSWVRGHLWELLVVALPMLRALRLLQFMTLAPGLRRSAGTALRTRIAIYGAGAALLLVYLGGLIVLDVERRAPGGNIDTFGDAIWWAFVTLATVGYGDFYPVTMIGRTVAVGLMLSGIAVVGVVTATLSSWIIERAALGRDDDEPSTRGQLRAVARQIDDLARRLGEPGDGTAEKEDA
ncbi:potassium channel family protein [Microbacterium fluvii]|uniref:Potassium channel family protein n=1 Tax=Microbacterium fluvii TaxID=415215 RepID=A0ABW2HI61_9MICO|nr:potassium channel family protein [Microbacterium fluvii]MCU4672832.1 potassium channel family protein [Microbacterium fluvii]